MMVKYLAIIDIGRKVDDIPGLDLIEVNEAFEELCALENVQLFLEFGPPRRNMEIVPNANLKRDDKWDGVVWSPVVSAQTGTPQKAILGVAKAS